MSHEYLKEIKRLVSCRDICERYGIDLTAKGYARCIFHNEKTASMKVYDRSERGFYCFGCGARGDCVDLVKRLFDIQSTADAAEKINTDFMLGLPIGKPPDYRQKEQVGRALWEKRKERQAEEQRRLQLQNDYKAALCFYTFCEYLIKHHKPESPESDPDPLFIFGLQHIAAAENELEEQETRRWIYENRNRRDTA